MRGEGPEMMMTMMISGFARTSRCGSHGAAVGYGFVGVNTEIKAKDKVPPIETLPSHGASGAPGIGVRHRLTVELDDSPATTMFLGTSCCALSTVTGGGQAGQGRGCDLQR